MGLLPGIGDVSPATAASTISPPSICRVAPPSVPEPRPISRPSCTSNVAPSSRVPSWLSTRSPVPIFEMVTWASLPSTAPKDRSKGELNAIIVAVGSMVVSASPASRRWKATGAPCTVRTAPSRMVNGPAVIESPTSANSSVEGAVTITATPLMSSNWACSIPSWLFCRIAISWGLST